MRDEPGVARERSDCVGQQLLKHKVVVVVGRYRHVQPEELVCDQLQLLQARVYVREVVDLYIHSQREHA